MATITASNIFVMNSRVINTAAVDIINPWNDRLAGTAFVESAIMDGFVLAMSLQGPTIVGMANINQSDGTWEIKNIAQKYDGQELVVLGISRSSNNNYAVASRVKTV